MIKTLQNTLKQDREGFVLPKSVQDAIPIRRLWPDEIFQFGSKFSKTIRFSDINYAIASKEDKTSMFLGYSELLNALDTGSTTKLTINNKRLNRQDFEQKILLPRQDDYLDGYRAEYNAMLMDKVTDSSNSVVQERYITLSVHRKTVEEARTFFDRVTADVTTRLSHLDAHSEELDAVERLRVLHDFYRTGEETEYHLDLRDLMRKGHSFKDAICPDSDDLTTRDQRMMFAVVTLVHLADSKEELDSDTDALQSAARKHLCQLSTLNWQQADGLVTALPLGLRRIDALRTLTTEALAVLMPFKAQEVRDQGGVYYGQNVISKNLIIANRKELLNGNGFVLGVSGSGKSFTAKREMVNLALSTDDDIIVIDPESEYRPLIEGLGGEVINISATSPNHINAMDMEQGYGDGENPVVLKSEFLLSLCEQLMGDRMLSAKEKSIIDRCTASVYHSYIKGGYQGKAPTLQDFHAELLRQSEPEARDVALAIELFTEGSLNTFAKPTNVDTDARILCYDIRDLGKQLLPVGMLVVLDSVFNRVIRNRALGRNTWVYIDEIYLLFQHEYSANFLFTLWKRVRKYGACCTGLTQNVDDLLQSHTARTMLANSEFLVMLSQAATDRAELAWLLNISDNQLSYITNAMYSRDISKKVSTALRAQMETGNFRNRNLPYGYLWNGDKTAYVVDEEAAAIVRQIFEWKLQEVSVYTIVERLKTGGIESPERHKRRAGSRNSDNIQGEGWCPSTIRGILQNRAYIGEMVCGKSETALYKGLKKHVTETDKWIVVPDAHPPIVSVSDFEAMERQMQKDSSHRETAIEWSADIRAGMIDLFAWKIFCADCGKRMYYKRQRICGCKNVTFGGVYDCSTHVRRGHATCFNHFIRQDALDEKVFNAIRDQLQVALDYEKLLLAMRGGSGEASVREKHKAAVASVKLRLNALKKKRAGLYESYVEGILNEEEYAFAKQTYEEQYEALNRLLDEAVERRERFLASISPDNKWLTMMRGAAGMTGLTQELVDAIIEKVLVYGGGRIEVVLNYNDVFYAMLECVEQIKEAGGDD